MKKTLWTAGAVIATASAASAAGIERASNDYGILFQDGHQATVSLSFVNPSVSGDYEAALGGGSTGNMSKNYTAMSAAYKGDFGDQLSFGLFLNDAYGADAEYTGGVYTGLAAEWDSDQLSAVLRYGVTDRISVYGGFRYVESQADIVIPEALTARAVANHATDLATQAGVLAAEAAAAAGAGDLATAAALTAEATALASEATTLGTALAVTPPVVGGANWVFNASGDRTGDWGYILGAAYEIPDIALRVGLTWESEIEHSFDTREVLAPLGIDRSGTTKVTMPQSVTLDFQSGVAQNTLVFGSIKWTEWSKWEVRTPAYEEIAGGEITGFENDTFTYRLGVGRKFTDYTSGFAQVRYEKANGGVASRLSPTDGMISYGIGGQFVKDNIKLRGGLEYVDLGAAEDSTGTKFKGNSAIGAGFSFSLSF